MKIFNNDFFWETVFKMTRELKNSVLLCLQIKVIFCAILVSSGPLQYNGIFAGRDCGQEEKGMTEDEMARWHHGLDRHESG